MRRIAICGALAGAMVFAGRAADDAVKGGRLTLRKRNRESSCFILRFAR